jgi:hypothetical protein
MSKVAHGGLLAFLETVRPSASMMDSKNADEPEATYPLLDRIIDRMADT